MRKPFLLFILTILPMVAMANAVEIEINGITYQFHGEGYETVQVSSVESSYQGALVIPRYITVDGKKYQVIAICDNAFKDCTHITSVTIPCTPGNGAFSGCTNLSKVILTYNPYYGYLASAFDGFEGKVTITFSDEVTTVGYQALKGCTSMKAINFSNSVTTIEAKAFEGCSNLESVTIPSSVTSVGEEAFLNCSGLKSVTISSNDTGLKNYAFRNCSSLSSVTIPGTCLAYMPFDNCNNLSEITITSNPTSLKNVFAGSDGQAVLKLKYGVTSIGSEAFYGAKCIKHIEFPTSLESIGSEAFYGCSHLATVAIPIHVTTVGEGAFAYCTGLASASISSDATDVGYYLFGGCEKLTSVGIPGNITNNLFNGCYNLSQVLVTSNPVSFFAVCLQDAGNVSVTLSSDVTSIADDAFSGAENITSINIPNSVTSIGEGAFSGCSRLSSINIPEGMTSIGNNTFSGCSSLTSFTIPNGVTSIGDHAFYGCGLMSLDIPECVTSIGYQAFSGCDNLPSITIPNTVNSIESGAFEECSGLTSITIPGSKSYESIFGGCDNLSEVFITSNPSNVSWAFEGYSGPVTVTLSEDVTSIDNNAFWEIENISSINFPNSLTSIGSGAFENCKGLTSVTLPPNVTSIGYDAFENCVNLTSVNIQCSPTDFPTDSYSYIFKGCPNIMEVTFDCETIMPLFSDMNYEFSCVKKVTLTDKVLSIGENAFRPFSGITSITIPESVTSIGDSAFDGCYSLSSITIPKNVISIGNWAFNNTSLSSATILCSPTSVGAYVFGEEPVLRVLVFDCETVTALAYSQSSLKKVLLTEKVKTINDNAFYECRNLKDMYCLATTVPEIEGWWWVYEVPLENVTLHVPQECIAKYEADENWNIFGKINGNTDDADPIPDVELTAQVENGLVRLHFNSIPKDLSYRVYRTDANGVTSQVFQKKESNYPNDVEYVDNPPTGSYNYYVRMAYVNFEDYYRTKMSNEIAVSVTDLDEGQTTQEYGTIMGRIDCDKNPPASGLNVRFSDGVTVSTQGRFFMRKGVRKGEMLTMTVIGDNAHEYESPTVNTNVGQNDVIIQGNSKDDYTPTLQENDLAVCSVLVLTVEDGKHHAKFSVKNLSSKYKWKGYVRIKAVDIDRYSWEKKTTYSGKTDILEIEGGATENVDIIFKKMELDEDRRFELYFDSEGKLAEMDSDNELKTLTSIDGSDIDEFPTIRTINRTFQQAKKWNKKAKEEFAYLMLGLSSLTSGMDGMVGELKPYKDKVASVINTNDVVGTITEWLEGKTALEAINDPNLFNVSSAVKACYDEVKGYYSQSLAQKYWAKVVDKVSEEVSADVMLSGMQNLIKMIKDDAGTSPGAFKASMACASMLYQLASLGNAVPLTSMMKTYMVVGESLINKAKQYGIIINGRYILDRLKANKEYTGDEEGRVNTTTDFKLIVNKLTWFGYGTEPIDFTDGDAQRQILDIKIKAALNENQTPAEFTYLLDFRKDCIMLRSDGNGRTGGSHIDEQNEIRVLFMEINWRNGRQTIIPLVEETDGIKINENHTTIVTAEFEEFKPLDYTVILTTTTGMENMADQLYLGTNEDKE